MPAYVISASLAARVQCYEELKLNYKDVYMHIYTLKHKFFKYR